MLGSFFGYGYIKRMWLFVYGVCKGIIVLFNFYLGG